MFSEGRRGDARSRNSGKGRDHRHVNGVIGLIERAGGTKAVSILTYYVCLGPAVQGPNVDKEAVGDVSSEGCSCEALTSLSALQARQGGREGSCSATADTNTKPDDRISIVTMNGSRRMACSLRFARCGGLVA